MRFISSTIFAAKEIVSLLGESYRSAVKMSAVRSCSSNILMRLLPVVLTNSQSSSNYPVKHIKFPITSCNFLMKGHRRPGWSRSAQEVVHSSSAQHSPLWPAASHCTVALNCSRHHILCFKVTHKCKSR